MDIDINFMRGLSTILVMVAFFGVCWWAYGSKKRKEGFDEAAMMPFQDEHLDHVESNINAQQATGEKQL